MDILIAGGGPAGLTAGIYSARAGMSTVIIDRIGPGGQMAFADLIDNYPGFPGGISGMELSRLMETQSEKFGAGNRTETIEKIFHESGGLTVQTDSAEYKPAALILAPGSLHRKLGIPGEREFSGRGVSYCALCDGPFFSGQEIAVIGGGDTAVHEAIILSKFAGKVNLIHRRKSLRAAKSLQDMFFSIENAEFMPETTVCSINGGKTAESLTLRSERTGDRDVMQVRGVFIAAGYEPATSFVKGTIPLDEDGYIIADSRFRTEKEGVFACGDAVSGNLKQIVSACGSGAEAAVSAVDYVENLKGISYG